MRVSERQGNMIQFNCPSCAKAFRVDGSLAGKQAKCSGCGQRIEVPRVPAPSSSATARPPLQSPSPLTPRGAEQIGDFIDRARSSSPPPFAPASVQPSDPLSFLRAPVFAGMHRQRFVIAVLSVLGMLATFLPWVHVPV